MSRFSKKYLELSAKKRALLEKLIQKEEFASSDKLRIPRRENPAYAPLSHAQQALWFIHKLEPQNPVYNDHFAIRLTGEINLSLFKQCINEIINRHDILRTTVGSVNEKPAQLIAPSLKLALSVVDLCVLPGPARQIESERLAVEESRRPFDLARGPLLRFTLLQLGKDDSLLLFTIHHIVTDGWSLGVFIRELSTLYETFYSGKPSLLPDLPIQYGDYAQWHRQWVEVDALPLQLPYWKENLANAPPLLELWTDRPRPLVKTYNGARQSFELSPALTQSLKSLAQRQGATMFMALLAAFKTLLYRYTGREDVVVGTPIAGRRHAEVGRLIGCFADMLVLRTSLSDEISFLNLLERVKQVTLGSYTHQDVPFEKLVEGLQIERDLSRTPLFQVVFVLQNSVTAQEFANLKLDLIEVDNGTAKFDLTLSLEESGRRLRGWLEYNTDLFDPPTIKRMVDHLHVLIDGIAHNTQQPIADLQILSQEEQDTLLKEWNNAGIKYPNKACLHELFERRAERTPDAVAIVCEGRRLTYGLLNARSNQVARHLSTLGAGPERPIGICMERAEDLTVGILGILKSGSAYLPIDPSCPIQRISFLLDDAQAQALLTQKMLIPSIDDLQVKVVYLDSDWEVISEQSAANLLCDVAAHNLAYVIYTSGSTGRPKGVLVTHAEVVRLFEATDSWFQFGESDVWSLFHSCAFDFSVWELWGALIYGGRLVVITYFVSRSPDEFYNLLCDEKVTVLNQTPSAFRQLIRADETQRMIGELSLRLVILGGEALETVSLIPWFDGHGDKFPRLVNMYGITETTVHVTYRQLTTEDVKLPSRSVIGCSIPDLQIYILDRHLNPAPIGIAGAIYVGGAGLARGYLNRPELTAGRFIPNRFSSNPGARLYDSGDAARYLNNGDIAYLGRTDHQVKVRGFRIELGEIETALAQHPSVRESVVLMSENAHGVGQLIGYVAQHPQAALTVSELRDYLKERLPEYMAPATFVMIEQFPLTPNGKLDRQALIALDAGCAEVDQDFVAPSTREERTLAGIWADVLGLKRVGVHNNFFALGGDSIRSIQIKSRALEQGMEFSIQQLFQNQTIYELVRAVGETNDKAGGQKELFSLIADRGRFIAPDGVEDAYPLTMLQTGMLFHSQYEPELAIYHNITSFHLRAHFDAEALRDAVQQVVNIHPALRTSFDLTSYAEPLQLVHKYIPISLGTEDISNHTAAEQRGRIAAFIESEKRNKFDYTCPPLVRFYAHRRSENTFQFTVTEHHAILDGWSVATMITEIFQHYLSLLSNNKPPLGTPPTVTFRDFVALEKSAIEDERRRNFWTERLSDAPVCILPRWTSLHNMGAGHERHAQEVKLPAEVCEGLKHLAVSSLVPLKSVLLAAHFKVLSFLTGQANLLTGLVFNGRLEEKDGDRALGLHLNTLPLGLKLSTGAWADLAQAAFRAETEVLPFRHYPLALLQKEAGTRQLFETIFNFIHFHIYDSVLNLDGIDLLEESSFQATNYTLATDWILDVSKSELKLSLDYDPAQLCDEQVTNIAKWYTGVAAAMAAQPLGNYDAHCFLSEQETRQLLTEWNETRTVYPSAGCIHQLFEVQASRTPDAIAIVFREDSLTYRELNQRANRLARYLQLIGVKPEVRVGVCLNRSIEMVTSLLGALKAGGAYVPLDPEYPPERLAFMLEDAQASILLTQSQYMDSEEKRGCKIICFDTDWQMISGGSGENLINQAFPDNLAYMIYTSGSTGRPKGVMISHQAICNRLLWMQEKFPLTANDAVLQKTAFGFDASVWEFFVPLLSGARLVMARPGGHRDSEYLVGAINRYEITILQLVPSLLRVMLDEPEIETCKSLKRVFCGGEALPSSFQERFFAKMGAELKNLYGPTETSIDATMWNCVPGYKGEVVPIGRPIVNIRIHILDSNMGLVPVRMKGHLHIGGVGVGRGYYRKPDLTAEKFVPDPFTKEPGARLYQSGDIACHLPNGDVEYIGRMDDQVKIRGFRIELGEIERALKKHEAIKDAAVAVRRQGGGEQQLVGYLVCDGIVTIAELRVFLKQRLPDHMVPSAFVLLENLPLTHSGKIDRRALPDPHESRLEANRQYLAPRNPTEQSLVNLWASSLGVERVGVQDDFFELGGDSLIAVRLVSKMRKEFQLDMPLQLLFESPTIAGVSDAIEKARAKTDGPQAIKPKRYSREPYSIKEPGKNLLSSFKLDM
jgi:amino acid adenylation domain-containing protein